MLAMARCDHIANDAISTQGEESLGMSMVYTLAMQLKESLTELLVAKAAARELEEQAAMLKVQEVCEDNVDAVELADMNTQEEMAAPKGTPVTVEAFAAWKRKFDAEMKEKRKRELVEEIRALPPKGQCTILQSYYILLTCICFRRTERTRSFRS